MPAIKSKIWSQIAEMVDKTTALFGNSTESIQPYGSALQS
jgi:hypothetical protein